MERRYPTAVVGVGGLLVAVSATAGWPVDDTSTLGVEWPVIAVLAFLALALIGLAGIAWADVLSERVFGVLVLVVAGLTMLFGAYGYAEVLVADIDGVLDELTALLAPLATLTGGAIAGVGGLTALLEIDADIARRRTRATGVMTMVGFGGILAMFIWANVLMIPVFLAAGSTEISIDIALIVSNVALGLGMGTVAAAYLVMSNRGWDFIDLKMPSIKDAAWTFVGIGALFAALIVVGLVMEFLGAPSPEHDLVEDITAEGDPELFLFVLIPASILIIGPAEELLFRNIIQKSLYDHFSRAGAIIVASFIFALAHIPAYWAGADTITAIIVITLLSLILGGIYAKTENIIVPAIIHGLYNAIQFAVIYLDMTSEESFLALIFWLA